MFTVSNPHSTAGRMLHAPTNACISCDTQSLEGGSTLPEKAQFCSDWPAVVVYSGTTNHTALVQFRILTKDLSGCLIKAMILILIIALINPTVIKAYCVWVSHRRWFGHHAAAHLVPKVAHPDTLPVQWLAVDLCFRPVGRRRNCSLRIILGHPDKKKKPQKTMPM